LRRHTYCSVKGIFISFTRAMRVVAYSVTMLKVWHERIIFSDRGPGILRIRSSGPMGPGGVRATELPSKRLPVRTYSSITPIRRGQCLSRTRVGPGFGDMDSGRMAGGESRARAWYGRCRGAGGVRLSRCLPGSGARSGMEVAVGREPAVHVFGGKLTIEAPTNGGQAFIARSPLASAYTARVGVLPTGTAAGGLAIIGDAKNEVGLSRRDGELELWRRDQEQRHVVWTKGEAPGKVMWLRVSSAGNEQASFSFSADGKVGRRRAYRSA